MATTTVTPEQLGDALMEDFARLERDQRAMLKRGIGHLQVKAVREAPRDKGDFAHSLTPYVAEPGATWQRGGGSDAGQAEVDAVVDSWHPGQTLGIATDAPYGRKLIFHAGEDKGVVSRRNRRGRRVSTGTRRTYTKKVSGAWLEKIMDESVEVMNRTPEAE